MKIKLVHVAITESDVETMEKILKCESLQSLDEAFRDFKSIVRDFRTAIEDEKVTHVLPKVKVKL